MTLTVAAIITSAVSLLIFGLTLLMQQGFDNLLTAWEGGVEMIVYVNPGATDAQRAEIESALRRCRSRSRGSSYCNPDCSMDEAQRLLAGDQATLKLITPENIPTQYKVVPIDAIDVNTLRQLRDSLGDLPNVSKILLADQQLDVISKLKGFVGLYTVMLSVALLFAAILLIWNTIRTAMFARRREIEVMKLVGVTDWFIRIPFMLEGLIRADRRPRRVRGALADQQPLDGRRRRLPERQRLRRARRRGRLPGHGDADPVGIGAVAGAIGSGIAASRFLDM